MRRVSKGLGRLDPRRKRFQPDIAVQDLSPPVTGHGTALGAQAGEAQLADVFSKAGFRKFRRAKATPFNLILEVKASCIDSKLSP
jgi:hypothetical protein